MSIEINRLIRNLEELAERHKGADLFVQCYDENGEITTPDVDHFEFDNDEHDRIVFINGEG